MKNFIGLRKNKLSLFCAAVAIAVCFAIVAVCVPIVPATANESEIKSWDFSDAAQLSDFTAHQNHTEVGLGYYEREVTDRFSHEGNPKYLLSSRYAVNSQGQKVERLNFFTDYMNSITPKNMQLSNFEATVTFKDLAGSGAQSAIGIGFRETLPGKHTNAASWDTFGNQGDDKYSGFAYVFNNHVGGAASGGNKFGPVSVSGADMKSEWTTLKVTANGSSFKVEVFGEDGGLLKTADQSISASVPTSGYISFYASYDVAISKITIKSLADSEDKKDEEDNKDKLKWTFETTDDFDSFIAHQNNIDLGYYEREVTDRFVYVEDSIKYLRSTGEAVNSSGVKNWYLSSFTDYMNSLTIKDTQARNFEASVIFKDLTAAGVQSAIGIGFRETLPGRHSNDKSWSTFGKQDDDKCSGFVYLFNDHIGGATAGSGDKGGSTSKPESTKNENAGELVVNVGNDANANYGVSGKVTVAIDTARATDYEALFDALAKAYPNIDLQFDYYMHSGADSAADYLIAKMQSGKNIPDIIWDEAGPLPTYLTQGYIYPLDSFIKNDPDFQHIPKNIIRDYTYCGKLYALPNGIHWEETYLDLDVMAAVNKSKPALDWTPQDYADLLYAAANDTRFGGMESMSMVPTMFTNCFNASTTKYGYNPETKQFDISGYAKAIEYTINTKNRNMYIDLSSISDKDYIARFGQRVGFTAFNNSKTIIHGVGSWEMADAKERWSNKNWVNWTVPQVKGSNSMPMHVDHCFMLSTTKNPEAAFQVLRFITYSAEGNIARLSMYDAANKGKYALINDLYYPATNHPDVAAKFNSLPAAKETEKYLFANIKNSMRFDMIKIIPGWSSIESNYLAKSTNEAVSGAIGNVDGVLKDMQSKANKAVSEEWSKFETKLKKQQADFAKDHPNA